MIRNRSAAFVLTAIRMAALLLVFAGSLFAADVFRTEIENDWQLQESHFGRGIDSPDALRSLLERGDAVIDRLDEEELVSEEALEKVKSMFGAVDRSAIESLSDRKRRELYRTLRWALRDLLFRNSLFAGRPLLFEIGRAHV